MSAIEVNGPCVADALELAWTDLAALPAEHQVADVGALVEGRRGSAVRLAALAQAARVSEEARFVHVASEDGGFSANVALDEALEGGLVLYALDGAELPRAWGGPFRLLFADGEDCSLNVKFLGRVAFVREPGEHTARCVD